MPLLVCSNWRILAMPNKHLLSLKKEEFWYIPISSVYHLKKAQSSYDGFRLVCAMQRCFLEWCVTLWIRSYQQFTRSIDSISKRKHRYNGRYSADVSCFQVKEEAFAISLIWRQWPSKGFGGLRICVPVFLAIVHRLLPQHMAWEGLHRTLKFHSDI